MMNALWGSMILASIVFALLSGRLDLVADAPWSVRSLAGSSQNCGAGRTGGNHRKEDAAADGAALRRRA